MSKTRLQDKLKFNKQEMGTIATIGALVLVMLGALVYIFNFLLHDQIERRTDYLNRQTQISASAIEGEFQLLGRDVHFFLSTLISSPEEDYAGLVERKNIYAFLNHHSDAVSEIVIFENGKRFALSLDETGSFVREADEADIPEFADREQEFDFEFFPDRKVLIYKDEDRFFAFKIDVESFIIDRLETSFSRSSGFKTIVTPDNEFYGTARVTGSIREDRSFEPGEKTAAYILDHVQDGVAADLEGKIIVDGKSREALYSMYPLNIFGETYGVVFAVPKSTVVTAVRNSFLIVAAVILVLTVLIVYILTLNIKRLKRSRNVIAENKKQLEDLVDQQKLLFEYSKDFTYRHDRNFNYDYVSENVQKVLGFTPEEFAGSEYRQFTQNPLNKAAREATEKVLTGKTDNENFYVELRDKNGDSKVLEVREKPFQSDEGDYIGVIGIAKDVTEKFMSDQKFRLLFEFSSDPHMIFNRERGIIDCNEATLDILGVKKKETILGKAPAEFSPEKQPDGRNSEFKAEEMVSLAGEKGQHTFEWTHKKVTGEEFPAEVTLTPVVLNEENVILTVWHDLTERKRVEKVLIEGREKAESLARSKQQFLSSMSHEIRTPLNAVIGYTQLLLDSNPRKDQRDKLKSLKFSADNLLSLVSDILDHSVIESGKIKFASEAFSIREKLQGVFEMMEMKAREKSIDIELNIDDKLPDTVVGDPTRLNQILVNICGNAVKFTDKGKVSIEAELLGSTKTHYEIRMKVKDTGIGIPKNRQKAIFKTFEQADLKILNTYGGTGLGLTITKNLVDLQGGSISVESEEGKGSVFAVEMSFKRAGESGKTAERSKDIDNLNGVKILLVEDNPINQKIAEQFLKRWGAGVEVASDGKEGLEKVSDKGFDLVLMDLQMPEMDGYEATRAIRKIREDYFQDLPIVCLTADAFTEVRERVLEAGMNDYVTKPIDSDQFFKVISKYVKREPAAKS